MFKANWEKTEQTYNLPSDTIASMAKLAYPDKTLLSHKLISGGCANLNIKLQFENDNNPLLLRIYFHDKDAAYREQKLGNLLKPTIPAPQAYYIGDIDGYRFAVTEFMPGITLRDLLLGNQTHDISDIMYQVGILLSKIATHKFPRSGFFDQNLNIADPITTDWLYKYVKDCLQDNIVVSELTSDKITKIAHYFDKYSKFFPNENDRNLVHADFDPANILVDKHLGSWKITAVLDWEFAFAGSTLCDLANMLRYEHKMPSVYRQAFLAGLKTSGVSLPDNWQISVNILNLLSLLDCLKRADPQNCPNQCADIRELIDYILGKLDSNSV